MLQQLLISFVSGLSSSKWNLGERKKSTPGNEVKCLLLEVELGLCKVDRSGAGGGSNKIEARLGIVDRGGSRGGGNKVEGSLGLPLPTSVAGNKGGFPALRGTDKVLLPVVLAVEVRLPAARGVDKAGLPIRCLPLATSSSSSNNCLLGSQPVQLRLGPVALNSRNTGASGRSNVSQLSVLVRL